MGKAKKLPSGNWRVQVSKVIDGKQIRKSFTTTDKRKAELMAAQWSDDMAHQNDTDKITLKQAFERYIDIKENILSPSTIINYKSITRVALQDIMHLPIRKLTQPQIQKSVNAYSANHSPKSVRNCIGLLTAVLGMFRPDFRVSITAPQKEKKELYIPDDEDMKKVLQAAEGTELEIPILLAAFGPMRRGEICAVTSDDIHGNIVTVNKSLVVDDQGVWRVKAPKTFSSYREIEYPDFVIDKIKNIEGRIVKITPSKITKEFLRLLRKNDIPEFRFHDLRHYAVSTLHAINVPDKYIMARGGWQTNYTMNNVYNHILKSKRDEMEEKIIKHFDKNFK